MQDQVSEPGLLERGAERVDELVWQLADEADGVGQKVVTASGPQHARGRIQRLKQAIADADGGTGERVQQRRFAGVRVTRERHRGQVGTLALGAHHRAARLDLRELASQCRDPVAREPAVGLDLGLARSAGPDPSVHTPRAEALQMGPQAPHPGEVVLELRELDLELALGAVRVRGKDVQDDRGPVDHRHVRAPAPGFAPGAARAHRRRRPDSHPRARPRASVDRACRARGRCSDADDRVAGRALRPRRHRRSAAARRARRARARRRLGSRRSGTHVAAPGLSAWHHRSSATAVACAHVGSAAREGW